jgi:hypothetical protein
MRLSPTLKGRAYRDGHSNGQERRRWLGLPSSSPKSIGNRMSDCVKLREDKSLFASFSSEKEEASFL